LFFIDNYAYLNFYSLRISFNLALKIIAVSDKWASSPEKILIQ